MKALRLGEPQISTIRKSLQQMQEVEIVGRAGQKIFQIPDLVAAGFEPGGYRLGYGEIRGSRCVSTQNFRDRYAV
jgi:hypothetical protein